MGWGSDRSLSLAAHHVVGGRLPMSRCVNNCYDASDLNGDGQDLGSGFGGILGTSDWQDDRHLKAAFIRQSGPYPAAV